MKGVENMLRESNVPLNLLAFKDKKAFLQNEDPKNVRQNVLKKNGLIISFGSKIEIERDDTIIITILQRNNVIISVSKYKGFGIFEDKYFQIVNIHGLKDVKLKGRTMQIVQTNIAALNTTA